MRVWISNPVMSFKGTVTCLLSSHCNKLSLHYWANQTAKQPLHSHLIGITIITSLSLVFVWLVITSWKLWILRKHQFIQEAITTTGTKFAWIGLCSSGAPHHHNVRLLHCDPAFPTFNACVVVRRWSVLFCHHRTEFVSFGWFLCRSA